jgi:hypothetical protein
VRVEEKIAFEPGSLEFGEIFLDAGFIKVVEVENRGRGSVTLTAVDLPEGFEVRPSQVALPPGEREELRINFRPKQVGRVETSLRFQSTAKRVFELPVRALAVNTSLVFEPETLDFGPVAVGEARKLPLKIRSLTDGNLDLHVSLRGTDFQTETGVIPLGGRQTIELEVGFSPRSDGDARGWLQILPCQGCPTLSATLLGEGQAPRLQSTPRSLEFGAVHPPLAGELEILVRNEGKWPAWVAPPSIDGPGAAAFSVVDGPSEAFPIEPGEEMTLRVGYVPGEEEGDEANLRLVTAEGGQALLTVALHGESGGALLGAEGIDFGVIPGGEQLMGQVVVRNVGTAGTPRLLGATFEGRDAAHVSLASGDSFPSDVAGEGLPLMIVYEAGEPGSEQEAELVLTTSHRFQPTLRVPLAGRAARAECELEFELPELRFGLVGHAPRERSGWLRHEGKGECFIWSVRLEQEGAAFEMTNTVPEGFLLLGQDEVREFRLRYTGDEPEGWSEGELRIHHSSRAAPPLVHRMSAFRNSLLQVSHTPEVLRFPNTPVGNLSLLPVQITQSGPHATVTATFTGPFRWEPLQFPPQGERTTLFTGRASPLPAAFVPKEAGLRRGEIAVEIGGQEEAYRIPVEGRGQETCSTPCTFPSVSCDGPTEVHQGEDAFMFVQSDGVAWHCRSGYFFPDGRSFVQMGSCLSGRVFAPHFDFGDATSVRLEALNSNPSGHAAHCEFEVDILPTPPP